MVFHQKTMLYPYWPDLPDVRNNVSDQEKILIAQDGLKDSQLLKFRIIVYYFRVSQENLESLLLVNLMIKGAIKLNRNRVQLFWIGTPLRLPIELDVVCQALKDKLTIGVVDNEAKLIFIDVLLNVLYSDQNVAVVRFLFDCHPAIVEN